MLDCLGRFNVRYMIDDCKDADKIQEQIDNFFKILTKFVDIPDKDTDLHRYFADDPQHPMVCLALYIYSLEPPFYWYLNQLGREFLGFEKVKDDEGSPITFKDPSQKMKVRLLGPFAWVLKQIMQFSGMNRKDKLTMGAAEKRAGSTLFRELGFYCMALNVYRGCSLKGDDIKLWQDKEGETIHIRGQMSTSLDFTTALIFSAMNTNPETSPVLILTTV